MNFRDFVSLAFGLVVPQLSRVVTPQDRFLLCFAWLFWLELNQACGPPFDYCVVMLLCGIRTYNFEEWLEDAAPLYGPDPPW